MFVCTLSFPIFPQKNLYLVIFSEFCLWEIQHDHLHWADIISGRTFLEHGRSGEFCCHLRMLGIDFSLVKFPGKLQMPRYQSSVPQRLHKTFLLAFDPAIPMLDDNKKVCKFNAKRKCQPRRRGPGEASQLLFVATEKDLILVGNLFEDLFQFLNICV